MAVLGFTFKKDTDDLRDSLAPKLHRYIQREMPAEVRVSEHHLPDPMPDFELRNWPVDEALTGVDCVFVATNHTGYDDALRRLAERNPEAWIADIWNVTGVDKVFYQAKELTP